MDGKACRIGKPGQQFWDAWRTNKSDLQALRISPFKHPETGLWEIRWWTPPTVAPGQIDQVNLSPFVSSRLRDYQIPLVKAMIAGLQTGNFMNASGCGAGKTYQALAACRHLGKRPVVVCRINAKPVWKEVAEYFGYQSHEITTINRESLRTGKTPLGAWRDSQGAGRKVRKFIWRLPENSLLIMDEIHCDASMTSLQAKVLQSAVQQGLTILGLSATAADSPMKMKAIGQMLGLHNGTDFFAWLYRNGCQKGDYGFEFNFGYGFRQLQDPKIQKEVEAKRIQVMASIHDDLKRRGRMIRLSTSEIPGFPKTQIIPVPIDFDDARINRIYADMQEELDSLKFRSEFKNIVHRLAGDGKKEHPAQIEIMMRARQRTELLKIPMLVERVQDKIEEGQSVAVFLNFIDSIKAFAERIGTTCIFTGQVDVNVREDNRKRFQADKERCIVLSDAGNESLSLHDLRGQYPRTALIMPTFWLESIIQKLGRVCRDGALTPSIQEIPFAVGTVEEEAYRSICQRKRQADAFNGDDFGDNNLMAGIRL